MLLVPPYVMGPSTSPFQRLLALADATVNVTMSPLPLDDHTPNPPLLSMPVTPNPSPSCPLMPVALHHTQSPLSLFFHSHSQSPPLEYQDSQQMIFGIGTPTQEDISNVRKNCQALLKAMEAQRRLESALEAWTEGLMPTINILGNDRIDDKSFLTTFCDFAAVQHLFFVPQVLAKIEPFIRDESVQSDKPVQLTTHYNPTISLSMTPSLSPIPIEPPLSAELEDPTNPGEGWALFDTGNPGHYPLIFLNEQNQSEVAKYICFHTTEEETHLVRTQGKGEAKYATPLYVKAYPSPNFNCHGIKDTDLNIFHPAHISHLLIDTTLVNLKDPGVLADVHRLRAYHNSLTCVKHQHLELDKEENHTEAKLLTVERHLASSAVCTWLQQHLLATCPPSPPTFLLPPHNYQVPHIFTAQGPPDVEEGEDNLECRAVLGKRCQGAKVKFPYCLRCCYDPEPYPQFSFPVSAIYPALLVTHSLLNPSRTARTATKSLDKSPDGSPDYSAVNYHMPSLRSPQHSAASPFNPLWIASS